MTTETDINELRRDLTDFIQSHLAAHATIQADLARIEQHTRALATREDLATLRESVQLFKEMVDNAVEGLKAAMAQFETTTQAMATKTDVDWLKRSFWVAVGAVVTLLSTLTVALALHVLGIR